MSHTTYTIITTANATDIPRAKMFIYNVLWFSLVLLLFGAANVILQTDVKWDEERNVAFTSKVIFYTQIETIRFEVSPREWVG